MRAARGHAVLAGTATGKGGAMDLTRRLATVAAVPVSAAIGALGAVRRARAFHPLGVALTGTWSAADDLLPPLSPARPWPVVVRISKGVGVPGRLPDVLGLAVRIVDLYGSGEHQDLLLSTSGTSGLARHLLRPTSDHGRATYSSLLPYETPLGPGPLWARARLADGAVTAHSLDEAADRLLAGDLTFLVGLSAGGRERLLGEVHLHERLEGELADALRFDPQNAGPSLCPTGAIQQLRERAYRASQRFRPTSEGDEEATEEAVARETVGVPSPGAGSSGGPS